MKMNVQTSIFNNEKRKSCAFTGHRELDDAFSATKITEIIQNLVQNGVEMFYNGGAKGFDLLTAEIVIAIKKINPQIKLCICVPCPNQEKYFSYEDKERYKSVCENADEIKVLYD